MIRESAHPPGGSDGRAMKGEGPRPRSIPRRRRALASAAVPEAKRDDGSARDPPGGRVALD